MGASCASCDMRDRRDMREKRRSPASPCLWSRGCDAPWAMGHGPWYMSISRNLRDARHLQSLQAAMHHGTCRAPNLGTCTSCQGFAFFSRNNPLTKCSSAEGFVSGLNNSLTKRTTPGDEGKRYRTSPPPRQSPEKHQSSEAFSSCFF